eukprot:RCo015417
MDSDPLRNVFMVAGKDYRAPASTGHTPSLARAEFSSAIARVYGLREAVPPEVDVTAVVDFLVGFLRGLRRSLVWVTHRVRAKTRSTQRVALFMLRCREKRQKTCEDLLEVWRQHEARSRKHLQQKMYSNVRVQKDEHRDHYLDSMLNSYVDQFLPDQWKTVTVKAYYQSKLRKWSQLVQSWNKGYKRCLEAAKSERQRYVSLLLLHDYEHARGCANKLKQLRCEWCILMLQRPACRVSIDPERTVRKLCELCSRLMAEDCQVTAASVAPLTGGGEKLPAGSPVRLRKFSMHSEALPEAMSDLSGDREDHVLDSSQNYRRRSSRRTSVLGGMGFAFPSSPNRPHRGSEQSPSFAAGLNSSVESVESSAGSDPNGRRRSPSRVSVGREPISAHPSAQSPTLYGIPPPRRKSVVLSSDSDSGASSGDARKRSISPKPEVCRASPGHSPTLSHSPPQLEGLRRQSTCEFQTPRSSAGLEFSSDPNSPETSPQSCPGPSHRKSLVGGSTCGLPGPSMSDSFRRPSSSILEPRRSFAGLADHCSGFLESHAEGRPASQHRRLSSLRRPVSRGLSPLFPQPEVSAQRPKVVSPVSSEDGFGQTWALRCSTSKVCSDDSPSRSHSDAMDDLEDIMSSVSREETMSSFDFGKSTASLKVEGESSSPTLRATSSMSLDPNPPRHQMLLPIPISVSLTSPSPRPDQPPSPTALLSRALVTTGADTVPDLSSGIHAKPALKPLRTPLTSGEASSHSSPEQVETSVAGHCHSRRQLQDIRAASATSSSRPSVPSVPSQRPQHTASPVVEATPSSSSLSFLSNILHGRSLRTPATGKKSPLGSSP